MTPKPPDTDDQVGKASADVPCSADAVQQLEEEEAKRADIHAKSMTYRWQQDYWKQVADKLRSKAKAISQPNARSVAALDDQTT